MRNVFLIYMPLGNQEAMVHYEDTIVKKVTLGDLSRFISQDLRARLLEVFAGRRKFHPRLAALALSLFAAGQALRLTAIRTLGWRWSTRVMSVPGPSGAPVQHGIYRYMRHPNYLGVELEILAAPLLHSAYLTSAVFGVANALLLRDRIRREEQALE